MPLSPSRTNKQIDAFGFENVESLSQKSSSSEDLNLETFGAIGLAKGTFEKGRYVEHKRRSVNVVNECPTRLASMRASVLDGSPSSSNSVQSSPVVDNKPLNLNAKDFVPGSTDLENSAANVASPFLQDLLDRLIRVELGLFSLKELSGQVANLRTDVDFLLRAQRQTQNASHSPTPSLTPSASPSLATLNFPPTPDTLSPNAFESIQHLSAQITSLTGTVSQLMANKTAREVPNPIARPQLPALSVSSVSSLRQVSDPTPTKTIWARPSSELQSSQSIFPQANLIADKWSVLSPVLTPHLLQSIVNIPNLSPPTKIQLKSIPCVVGKQTEDIVAQVNAPMESVLIYVTAALQYCLTQSDPALSTAVLIIAGTVDRASQAHRYLHEIGNPLGVRSMLALGRSSSEDQSMLLRMRPQIMIGTTQALGDLVAMRLIGQDGSIKMLILDEADILVQSVSDQLMHLVTSLPQSSPALGSGKTFDPFGDNAARGVNTTTRQTAIFGSVIHPELLNFASALKLREPVRVLVRKAGSTTTSTAESSALRAATNDNATFLKQYKHQYLFVAIANRSQNQSRQRSPASDAWKLEAVADFFEDGDFNQSVAFCATPEAVEALSFKLASRGIEVSSLNADMGAQTRDAVISKFASPPAKECSKKVLVVLDILCRSLQDVPPVNLVINFDVSSPEVYVHQAMRASLPSYRPGMIVNVVCSDEDIQRLRSIESYFGLRFSEVPLHQDLA